MRTIRSPCSSTRISPASATVIWLSWVEGIDSAMKTLDDYRDVAGVKMPFKYSYAWVSERDDWTFTAYEPNVNIDNAKFGRPDPKTAGDVQGRTAK